MTERSVNYRMKSLKGLIDAYAFESGRDSQEDREATKKAIVNEVYARIKDTFDVLDADPDAVDQIYKHLIEH